MHDGCTFNHRYVKANPNEVENATWMLTVSFYFILLNIFIRKSIKSGSLTLLLLWSIFCAMPLIDSSWLLILYMEV